MNAGAGIARPSCLATRWLLWLVVAVPCGAQTQRDARVPPQQLHEAVRERPGEAARPVPLPDFVTARPGGAETASAVFRLHADLGPDPRPIALYLPGVYGSPRVSINGHVLLDRIASPLSGHRGNADRLLLATLPTEFLRPGRNDIEVMLASPRGVGLSAVWVGDEGVLRTMHSHKLFWQVTGPLVAAAVIMALSLCVLVLWARRPGQTLYGYFGIGGMLWSLHTIWVVSPDRLLPAPHQGIWFNYAYALFVAPLVVFCLRLAEWRLPKLERSMWIGLALGPILLYAANFAGIDNAQAYWRLLWIGTVVVGVYAVGAYALKRRDTQGTLLLATGVIALAFGVRDWLVDQTSADNNPVFLTSYSGLLFFPLVAWILIDGFVQAARELELLNAGLEQRVAEKSAQLRLALEEMRAAKDAAEAANRAKSSFLAAASHDLRQPTHALGLYMAALRGETHGGRRSELAERMSESIAALNAMFNTLLDVARMDAGAVLVEVRPFALDALLHRLAHELSSEAADRGLRLSVRIGGNPQRLNALSDPLLVERIVRNLLANGVKHTGSGGVLLACRLRGASGQPHRRVEVWDTGPGIPAAQRERVFDEFFRLGHPERDRTGGMGLGLSIVKRLSQLLGHRLTLDSNEGRGSRFAVEIPATALAAAPKVEARPSGTLDGLRVGVLEDDPEVREAMRTLLEGWGCVVTAAACAEELVAAAAKRPADALHALIVDYQLGKGRTGIEAIGIARRTCARDAPALIVSGASAPDRLLELQASGFDWMIKPVPAPRLRSWLILAMRDLPARSVGNARAPHGAAAEQAGPIGLAQVP
jgi:signal transduction histidine kinase